jgi:hypothetical protein
LKEGRVATAVKGLILLYLFIKRVIKLTVVFTRGISLLLTTNKIVSSILLSRLTPYIVEIMGDH